MSEVSFNTIHSSPGSRRRAQRVGRGGKRGTTSGRGTKGQRARSGGRNKLAYKGIRHVLLQTPQRRGHANKPAEKYTIVNISDLERVFNTGTIIDSKQLLAKGVTHRIAAGGVKVLGDGKVTKSFTVKARAFSESAKEKIEKAGGKAEVIGE